MTDRQFTGAFIATTALLGWLWHIAQDFNLVPFAMRVVGGGLSVFLLNRWLLGRLQRNRRAQVTSTTGHKEQA